MTSAINDNLRQILEIVNERFDADLPDDEKGKLTENDWLSINNLTAQTYKQVNEMEVPRERQVVRVVENDTPWQIWLRTPYEIRTRWKESVKLYFQTYASKISPSTIKYWSSHLEYGPEGLLRDGTDVQVVFRQFFTQPETEVPLDIADYLMRRFPREFFFMNLCDIYRKKRYIWDNTPRVKRGEVEPPDDLNTLLQDDMDRTADKERTERRKRRQGWRPHIVKVSIVDENDMRRHIVLAEAVLHTQLRNLVCIAPYLQGRAMKRLGEIMLSENKGPFRCMYDLATIDITEPMYDTYLGGDERAYWLMLCQSQRPRMYRMNLGGNLTMVFRFEEPIL